jgi:hypothetical protein
MIDNMPKQIINAIVLIMYLIYNQNCTTRLLHSNEKNTFPTAQTFC